MKSQKVKISEIRKNPDNPRTIKDEKFKKLVQSLKDFPEMMQLRPVVVNKEMLILGGNMRFEAAKSAGWKEIDIIISDLPKAKQKEFILKDNVGFGAWDFDMLASDYELTDLLDWGFDEKELDLSLWNKDDDDKLDDVPEPQKEAISKLGDLFLIDGKHRLLCADSTERENLNLLMEGKKADMIFTDPPYNVNYEGGLSNDKNGGLKSNGRRKLQNDDLDIYPLAIPIMAEFCNGAIYTWFADTKAKTLYESVEHFGDIHSLIIWVKNGGYGALNANYKQKHEPCLYWKAKNKKLNFVGGTTETTVWEINKDGVNKEHPTQKPIALALKAIGNHSAGLILDLFMGGGTTLVASNQLNRISYGLEIDPIYIDVILRRYKNLYPEAKFECLNRKFDFKGLFNAS